MNKEILTSKAPAAIGPYSQAIQGGNLIYVSGQLPIVAETGNMPEDIREQAKVSLENVKNILDAAGFSTKDVMKTTVYLADINDFSAVNEVYATYFEKPFPARAAFAVAALPKGAKVEIEAVAYR